MWKRVVIKNRVRARIEDGVISSDPIAGLMDRLVDEVGFNFNSAESVLRVLRRPSGKQLLKEVRPSMELANRSRDPPRGHESSRSAEQIFPESVRTEEFAIMLLFAAADLLAHRGKEAGNRRLRCVRG